MRDDSIGYVVVEVNQASHQPERVNQDLYVNRESAETCAAMDREDAVSVGRRERYIVCEVIPVETEWRDD